MQSINARPRNVNTTPLKYLKKKKNLKVLVPVLCLWKTGWLSFCKKSLYKLIPTDLIIILIKGYKKEITETNKVT